MATKNRKRAKSKSDVTDGFRISDGPMVVSAEEAGGSHADVSDIAELPRAYGAPMLFAIARDPCTIFAYWSIDWLAIFAKTVPVDRQAHLRVYSADGVEEKSVPVEPMAGNCYITVSRPGASYHVEIGYYQPPDVWNSIASSEKMTMPPDSFGKLGDVDLATIPLHLSFQRLLDLFGASKGDALAETISQFQKRALSNEKRKQLSSKEGQILQEMDLSLSEIAAARRAFSSAGGNEILARRTEMFLGFGPGSPSRAFGEGGWASGGS
jgi:hypothetical protein